MNKQKWDKEKSCEAHKYFPADRGTQEIAHKYLILIIIWTKHFINKFPAKVGVAFMLYNMIVIKSLI